MYIFRDWLIRVRLVNIIYGLGWIRVWKFGVFGMMIGLSWFISVFKYYIIYVWDYYNEDGYIDHIIIH
jgi:hypothetical protein